MAEREGEFAPLNDIRGITRAVAKGDAVELKKKVAKRIAEVKENMAKIAGKRS